MKKQNQKQKLNPLKNMKCHAPCSNCIIVTKCKRDTRLYNKGVEGGKKK